jgi:hypothetical protein
VEQADGDEQHCIRDDHTGRRRARDFRHELDDQLGTLLHLKRMALMSVTSATGAPKHHTSYNTHQLKTGNQSSAGPHSPAQPSAATQRRLPPIYAGGKVNKTA